MHIAADKNASDCDTAEMDMNAISTDSDTTVDLIDFMDSRVELMDCRTDGQSSHDATVEFDACIEDVTKLVECIADQRVYIDECREFIKQTVRRNKVELTVDFWPGIRADDCTGPDQKGLAEWPSAGFVENDGSQRWTGPTNQATVASSAPVRTRRVAARHRPYVACMIRPK